MYVGDFAVGQGTDKNRLGGTDMLCEPKDFVTLGVAPPIALDRGSRDVCGQRRFGAMRGFQHHAVGSNEIRNLARGHLERPLTRV